MRYLSVCSGIEAATVAWHSLGWTPVAFSEIEPFPSAVLKHHYPTVPNWGDMTKYQEWPDEPIDLLVGGTPCQSFSVAGLRKGLADPRGNLMLTYGAIARRYRPEWLVWENVPGVLSSNGGRDFGTFLGMLAELGYGFAYRVLDAQYFGVAQRRRRVFVVANARSWHRAAAVLFESESVCRNPPPSRETRQGVARGVTRCFAGSSESGVAGSHWDHPSNPHPTLSLSAKGSGGIAASDQELFSQRGSGLVAQPVAFHPTQDPISSVNASGPTVMQAMAFEPGSIARNAGPAGESDLAPTLRREMGDNQPAVRIAMQVRRLTPVECERLQGFPDNYTNIPWRKKPESPDGPRYKALGNSMAVPVMRWIGERINKVNT